MSYDNKKVLALICARGGSKGLPRKNLRALGGVPLIGWSIKVAHDCGCFDRIVVSTDDKEIAEVARQLNAEVPFLRPKSLAQDDSPEWMAWQHAVKTLEEIDEFRPDCVVVLPPTSPFRAIKDVKSCLACLYDKNMDIVTCVSRSRRNPYFNMVEVTAGGQARICKQLEGNIVRRQDAPSVYDMTTVCYAVHTDFLMSAERMFDGRVDVHVIPEIRALDIDTFVDFKFAEFLLCEGISLADG